MSATERLWTVDQLAEYFQVRRNAIYTLVRERRLPAGAVIRLGRQLRFEPGRIKQWVEGGGQALPGGWRKEPRCA